MSSFLTPIKVAIQLKLSYQKYKFNIKFLKYYSYVSVSKKKIIFALLKISSVSMRALLVFPKKPYLKKNFTARNYRKKV